MLDESIPLTTFEFDEWGNPKDKAYFDYIMQYSPYDNVEAKDYPHTLITTGYWDSQVQYWEPAKWVARLRALKTDGNQIIFDTDLDAGHGGASGRFKRYEKTARVYAFFMQMMQPFPRILQKTFSWLHPFLKISVMSIDCSSLCLNLT